jgi:hypothetical protein
MPERRSRQVFAHLYLRALRSLRLMRRAWTTLAAVAVLCVVATAAAIWFPLSHRIDVLKSDNAVLRQRIDALASTPPSQWRRLNDRARGLILAGLETAAEDLKVLVIYASADSEARQYAAQFVDAARLVGVDARAREDAPSASAEVGLAIGIAGPTPSEQAERLKDILSSAGLDVRYAPWTKRPGDDVPVDFALLVGPKPW